MRSVTTGGGQATTVTVAELLCGCHGTPFCFAVFSSAGSSSIIMLLQHQLHAVELLQLQSDSSEVRV
jgi:hypothetical protein